MKIAAIDLGTNSFHLLVAEIDPDGVVHMIDKARAQVMLGQGGIGQHHIAAPAFERGVEAMRSFVQRARLQGVTDIHTAATSAVREADNGPAFCAAVQDATGVHVRVVTGQEEARLVWMGVRSDLSLQHGPVALCDLGGGSTEIVVGDVDGPLHTLSFPLGHIRLAEAFHKGDLLTPEARREMKRHIREVLQPLAVRVQRGLVTALVGTSGTARCLARIATLRRGASLPAHEQGLLLYREELEELLDVFERTPRADLARMPGMDDKRADTIVSGAVLVREVMKLLGTATLSTSERSLRDGLLVDWAERNRPELKLSRTVPDPRERSIRLAMQRFAPDVAHADHVARMALVLFDGTARVHGLDAADRQLLRAAALLHDIGHHIADKGHHRHGQYLLENLPMAGFTAPDIGVLGSIVRYHGRSEPKGSHSHWRSLSASERARVRVLAGILRVADALDRSHAQALSDLSVSVGEDRIQVRAVSPDGGDLEHWSAEERRGMLERALDRPIHFDISAPAAA